MPEQQAKTVFAKLVLDTLEFRYQLGTMDEETCEPADPDLDGAVRADIVSEFRSQFFSLVVELESLGYEVFTEFYTDDLISDDGYELSLRGVHEDDEEAEEFRSAFHDRMFQYAFDLPSRVSDLEKVAKRS